jgi:hypothetical protein
MLWTELRLYAVLRYFQNSQPSTRLQHRVIGETRSIQEVLWYVVEKLLRREGAIFVIDFHLSSVCYPSISPDSGPPCHVTLHHRQHPDAAALGTCITNLAQRCLAGGPHEACQELAKASYHI